MPYFGERSKQNLQYIHPMFRLALDDAIKIIDFSVICGLRGDEEQQEAYDSGHSGALPGQSMHNLNPARGRFFSWAIDFIPHPFRSWENDDVRFAHIAGVILACMYKHGLIGRWGNDWDRDGIPVDIDPDEKRRDLPHVEIVEVFEYVRKQVDPTYSFIPIED